MSLIKSNTHMQALQWNNQRLNIESIPLPERLPGEVLIKVSMAGICNTDLEIIRGYYPFQGTLGHEFVGYISEADNANLIGRRVVCDINCSCQHCHMCKAGHPHHCLNRQTIGINNKNGAFAEYLTAPVGNLVFVPENISDEQAVFAEPLAAALEILEQVDFTDIDRVAVIGDGKLGLLITMCLAAHDLSVTLIGHHPEKQALVEDLGVELLNSSPAKNFAVVVEATGNPSGFKEAMRLTQAKGTLVLKSTYAEELSFNPAPLVVNEITLLGSRCGPMQKAIDLISHQGIFPQRLINAVYPLEQGIEAFDKAQQRGSLKVLITLP